MDKISNTKLGKDGGRVGVSIDFNVFRFRQISTKIEVSKVDSSKQFVFTDNSIEEDFDSNERSNGGRNVIVAGEAITTGRTAYAAVDGFGDSIPLFFNHAVIVSGFFQGFKEGFEGAGINDEFKELFDVGSEPVGLVKAGNGGGEGQGVAVRIKVECGYSKVVGGVEVSSDSGGLGMGDLTCDGGTR